MSVGLGLEWREEPVAAWSSDHRLLGTVVKVFPEVAYAGGWWVVFEVVGGATVATLFIKISGCFTGVCVCVVCMQDNWDQVKFQRK